MKKLKNTRKTAKNPGKYVLYENAVQSPEVHIRWFKRIGRELSGHEPLHLREDFCGTFYTSAEWVKENPRHRATVLDLDPEPLNDGRLRHWARLKQTQKRRMKILQKDVISITRPAADMIAACNFSFCDFHDRKTLLKYFRKCCQSLKKGGVLVLEQAGGPGMIAPMRESRTVRYRSMRYKYVWHQREFNPISRNAKYSIHFVLADGTRINHAFKYDWRMWTIPELRDVLKDAGFSRTAVYWETEHDGDPTGEFIRTEHGDNAFAWVAYIVGVR